MSFSDSWIIYEYMAGSHSYGTNTPESDEDFRGIAIPPKEYFWSPFKNFEQFEDPDGDRVIYDIRKFFTLARNANPNIVEMLFAPEKLIKKITKEGDILRENRNLFLSAKCKFTYSGYAYSQLNRIKTHKKWIDNPPSKPEEPKRSNAIISNNTMTSIMNGFRDFVAQEVAEKLHKEMEFKAIEIDVVELRDMMAHTMADFPMVYFRDYAVKFFKSVSNSLIKDEYIEVLNDEFDYYFQLNEWRSYENWKKNRNPKRAELEAKYGYDTKHAMHLIRLFIQGAEILNEGTLSLDVHDNKDIRQVRAGEWSYEQLLEKAEEYEKHMNSLYKSGKLAVPQKPNDKMIENLYWEVVCD